MVVVVVKLVAVTVLFIIVWCTLLIPPVDGFALHNMSPRVVFTKQGPVQGFLGPADTGIYHTPHYSPGGGGDHRERGFDMRQYSGKPIVEIFRGIPYASPPIGPLLRYESPSPLPHRSRTEVFNANVSHPSCPRLAEEVLNRTGGGVGATGNENVFRTLRKTLQNSVEDCLYLDIYAPLNSIYYNAGDKNRGSGLAVLVYMNSHPDDPNNPFDGSSVAAIGNIIVISVRYRTGVLGFLQPSYSEDVRSNFGLWDQLAALQWIKENIGEFGGDSGNISLMGFDIDATVAGLLALSPVSQAYNGLFHRLILINGSPFAPNAINPEPIRTTYQLARALPCPTDERSGDLAKCLRSMPVPRLVTAAEKNMGAPPLTFPFSPIADGIIVPHEMSLPSPGGSPGVQEMLRKYDILCGLREGPVLPRVGRSTLNNIDLDRFITAVIKLTMKMESGVEPTPEVKKIIRNAIINDQGYGTSPPMRELISDFLVVQPIIDLLNAHAKTEKNTFFYVFKDFDPLNLKQMDEISYIFSSAVYKWKYTGSPSHAYKLHPFVMLINLLANFVRNGDPNIADPTDRFKPPQSWPQFTEEYGRYLEIADDVKFPSNYRKHSTTFWGKTFLSIMKSFANKSLTDTTGLSTFPEFPPSYQYPNRNQYGVNSQFPPGYHPPEEDPNSGNTTPSVILGGQSSIVLIGCLLLLLNFLCFVGLFYQRDRLRKAEVRLRKRYVESTAQADGSKVSGGGGGGSDGGIECSSSFLGGADNHVATTGTSKYSMPQQQQQQLLQPHPHHHPHNLRDNMSETETENGFGPDFLGPNYDPRTKVNRWMQMQRERESQNSQNNDYGNILNYPPGGPHPHQHRLQRLSHVREDDDPPLWRGEGNLESYVNPYEITPSQNNGPIYAISTTPAQPHPHHHHHPHIIGLDQVPPSYLLSQPQGPQHPLQIQINSLQRKQPHPPKAVPDPPVQFLPQMPYQEPYKPSIGVGSDIPYADSRATSPSIISAPAGFSNSRICQNPYIPASATTTTTTTSTTPTSTITTTTSTPTSTPKGILISSNNPSNKRSSTLIVRDLDPPQPGEGEPKYVPVKTGTLKRSVAVDTNHDTNHETSLDSSASSGATSTATIVPNNKNSNLNGATPTAVRNSSNPSSTVRVTFKENL